MSDFIANCLEIVPGQYNDYKILAPFHYRPGPIRPCAQIYKIRGIKKCRDDFPDPIAVCILRQPLQQLRARNIATKNYFKTEPDLRKRFQLINRKILYLARLIVDPRYRRIGLGTWLVCDVLERQTIPIIETLTPIDFTNKLFQKAGFKLYHNVMPQWYRPLTKTLLKTGLTLQSFDCPPVVHNRLQYLPKFKSLIIQKQIQIFMNHFPKQKHWPNSLERTTFFLEKLAYPEAYLIWFNPKVPYDSTNQQQP